MAKRILILNGHPDPDSERFCAALCDSYAAGALSAGHSIRRLDVGALNFPVLRSAAEFERDVTNADVCAAQEAFRWAEHVLIVHPLWLGSAPALTKAFLEQVFRYGFALRKPGSEGGAIGLLGGRSARLVVTMGMPALAFRWLFGAHGARALERGVLALCGFKPVRRTYIGGMGATPPDRRRAHLDRLRRLGASGS